MVKVTRFLENPLICPEEVKPYHDGYEVIGTFNAGVAEYQGETLLLLRVAERPIVHDPKSCPLLFMTWLSKKSELSIIVEMIQHTISKTVERSVPRTIWIHLSVSPHCPTFDWREVKMDITSRWMTSRSFIRRIVIRRSVLKIRA